MPTRRCPRSVCALYAYNHVCSDIDNKLCFQTALHMLLLLLPYFHGSMHVGSLSRAMSWSWPNFVYKLSILALQSLPTCICKSYLLNRSESMSDQCCAWINKIVALSHACDLHNVDVIALKGLWLWSKGAGVVGIAFCIIGATIVGGGPGAAVKVGHSKDCQMWLPNSPCDRPPARYYVSLPSDKLTAIYQADLYFFCIQ